MVIMKRLGVDIVWLTEINKDYDHPVVQRLCNKMFKDHMGSADIRIV